MAKYPMLEARPGAYDRIEASAGKAPAVPCVVAMDVEGQAIARFKE